jgi:hypothetical protein
MTTARFFINGLSAAVFAAATMLASTAASAAPFDGTWSVLIVTQKGPCDSAYRYGLSIRNGVVTYEGSAAVNVSGRVNRVGGVSVRLWAGSQSASGTGRLSRAGAGRGTWSGVGSSGRCSGYWTAERR